ncbi:MAG: hypothetical protein ACKVOQ_07200 [Cyclobacteriaceae bacterium]
MRFLSSVVIYWILPTAFTFAQEKVDTIYTFNKTIVGKVKEVGHQEVLYTLPNEDVIYRLYKRAVLSIAFHSDRKEVFNEKKDLIQVRTSKDWEKIELTTNTDDVAGMIKIDLVSVKATGPFTVSSVTNIQNRALRKLKYAAAMLGGDKVLISNQSIEGNIFALRTTRTQVTGTVYRTVQLDTVGLSKNVIGGKYRLYDKQFLYIDNPVPKTVFVSESTEIEIKSTSFEFDDGLVYLKINLGLGIQKFLVTFQSQTYIIAGNHSNSRFVGIVLKRIKS